MLGKLSNETKKRLPPGQYLTTRFPVLHMGPVPVFDLKTWKFRVWGVPTGLPLARPPIKPSAQKGAGVRLFPTPCAGQSHLTPCFSFLGIVTRPSIPPSACIPVLGPWSDLIVARVYACVVRDGGAMHGQTAETE